MSKIACFVAFATFYLSTQQEGWFWGDWLLAVGLDCSSAAPLAFTLYTLHSNIGFPLANIDCQGCGSSKQQHYPCLANRGTLSRRGIWTVGERVLPVSNISSSTITFAFALSIAIHRGVIAGERGLKWLIHCGLVSIVRWLLCIVIATIRSTIRCVGARVVWRVALRGGIYLRRQRHCTYTHQNAYHNDMQRPVKEAFRIGEMIVFVSHDCI